MIALRSLTPSIASAALALVLSLSMIGGTVSLPASTAPAASMEYAA